MFWHEIVCDKCCCISYGQSGKKNGWAHLSSMAKRSGWAVYGSTEALCPNCIENYPDIAKEMKDKNSTKKK